LYRIVLHAVDFSSGFDRERTRDLGYQRPACKPLDQIFPNCGPRTTGSPRVLPLWSS
jgi:hypothetical protein